MRVYWRCAPPQAMLSWAAMRVLILCLLVTGACFIVLYSIVETHTLWARSHKVESHELANKKFSVAQATDVDNPLLHYGIVVDCGSSGSRVFVYFWPPHDGNPQELLNIQQMFDEHAEPVVMKITPGLSSYAETPSGASDYIEPLLKYAASKIPKEKHKETPLYVMSTAGMRVLTKSQQDGILNDLRTDLPKMFPFQVADSHIEVISGKQEGIFAWIAVNFSLGKFNHIIEGSPTEMVEPPGTRKDEAPHVRKRTVGMIDMGGGSMQLAFEVPRSEDIQKSLLAEFSLGCTETDKDHNYRVYVTTYLGYGGNMARTRYLELLVNTTVLMPTMTGMGALGNSTVARNSIGQTKDNPILDPCLPLDMEDKVTVYDRGYYLLGTGNFMACQSALKPLLNLHAPCPKQPCAMDGMFQPQINFQNSEFYGFSELFYSTEDILRLAGRYDYSKFAKAASEYCSTPSATLQDWFEKKLYPKASESRFRMQCFKSAWVAAVLHDGLGFPRHRHSGDKTLLTTTQLIENKEIQWTLGALVHKTRYFPLRDLDGPPVRSAHYRPPWMLVEAKHTSLIILVCILVVAMAIITYMRRLGISVRKQKGSGMGASDLRRVPTMSYFMTDEDQREEGVKIVMDHHGYEDTLPFLGVS